MPDDLQNNQGQVQNQQSTETSTQTEQETPPDSATPPRPRLFSDEFTALIGEDLANKVLDQLCQGLTTTTPPQHPTTLCLELIVYEMDEDILREIVRCVFSQFDPVQTSQHIINLMAQIDRILNGNNSKQNQQTPPQPNTGNPSTTPPNNSQGNEQNTSVQSIAIDKFKLLQSVTQKIDYLKSALLEACDIRETIFEEILFRPTQLPPNLLNNLYAVTDHVIIQQFREHLITQHDNFALKLCNKVSCINSDLEFIADQIKQVTINYPSSEQGIIEIARAAATVAEAFFGEEDDFAEIFDAVDEVAEVIEELAEFYQVKLAQLQKLLSLSISGCPVPIAARTILPSIPETPPPPPIFPVVGLTSPGVSPFLPNTISPIVPTTIVPPIFPGL